jgi:hypothetical protein
MDKSSHFIVVRNDYVEYNIEDIKRWLLSNTN